jgi:hypothetical protein
MSPEDSANKPKEALIVDTFEAAWKKLPELLDNLPLRQQIKYKLQMTEHSRISLLQPWDQVLNQYIPETQRQAKENTIPSHVLNESEARIAIMTNSLDRTGMPFYMSVLHKNGLIKDFDNGRVVADQTCLSFLRALDVLKSKLPWSRGGYSLAISQETVIEGLNFIKNAHPGHTKN